MFTNILPVINASNIDLEMTNEDSLAFLAG